MSQKQRKEALREKRREKDYRDWLMQNQLEDEGAVINPGVELLREKRRESILGKGKKGSHRKK